MNGPRVFVSYAWSEAADYSALVRDLMESGFWLADSIVPAHDPIDAVSVRTITTELRKRIRSSSVVLVIGGKASAESEWVRHELEWASDMGKPIIAIVPPGGGRRVPPKIRALADRVVSWNATSISRAIREELARAA
jgi:hypothetical protein